MSKRRLEEASEESDIDINSTDEEVDSDQEEAEQSEGEIINIDFDFFDINKEIDFHSLKNLARQLIGEDSKKLNLSALTDLILESPTTTIKTDGNDSDPYAFLAPLSFKELKNTDYMKYIHGTDTELSGFLNKISAKKNCLLFSERLINMPIQVIPAMYRIVLEDIEKSEGGESFHYDNYLIPSRKYEVNNETDENSNKRIKTVDLDYYHFEDEFFESNAQLNVKLQNKNGIVQTFIVLDHKSLIKALEELEAAIAAE
ncbi:hypothetical protein WICPIJ_006139 [Wickerhamomyces pijperi]|uniref:Protein BCP1 n=1 Tax=Wickerhamomyces pijperi TaxID=599730 RepID=A0A9P8Q2M5_WICPI|nr:hypothetical protein WICPIJ_006139 [Wickerhamomyces pijperi]